MTLNYKDIHSSSIVINHACPFVNPGMADTYVEKLQAGGITLAMSSVAHNHSFRGAIDQITAFYRRFESDSRLLPVTHVQDIHRAKEVGKIGVGFHFQNSRPMENDLALLDVFYRLGVRVIQLTYNEKNLVGDGCTEHTDCGLSKFGKAMIKRMNELGLVVDLSHVGYKTSMEAMQVSKAPVIFSHSNAHSVCPSKRNLKDDQIKALARINGVIGINAFPAFVKKHDPTLEDLLDHIDYISDLAGPDRIGIGFDFAQETIQEYQAFGYDPETYPLPPWAYPRDIDEVSKTPNLTKGLLARGYTEENVKKILGENFVRVFMEVWK